MTNLLWIITIFLVFSAVHHIHHIIYRYTSLCNICGYYNLVQVDMEKKIDTSIVSNIPNREPTDVKLHLHTELTRQFTTKIKSNCIMVWYFCKTLSISSWHAFFILYHQTVLGVVGLSNSIFLNFIVYQAIWGCSPFFFR